MINLHDVPPLREALQIYSGKHSTGTSGKHSYDDYLADRNVHDEYTTWTSVVQETTLGGLNEEQRRDEFALQAAYVVFIRLLLIRVCEDKGIFPGRFISDGGLKHWQEDIERYFVFAQGNPYDPLLDMAYANDKYLCPFFYWA